MSTPSNATVFAVYGQLYNLSGVIKAFSTGNPVTAGLTGLAASISKNDGAFVACANTPVEVGVDSGFFTLDLTATEMSANKVLVVVSASNASSVNWILQVTTLELAQFSGRYDAQGVLRLEQLLMDLYAGLGLNGVGISGAAETFSNPDGSVHFGATIAQGETSATRSKTA
jgi:hypothetical protein